MARSPHYKGNDEGGYGNPPVSHQFKGKPGPGRPRGSRSIDGALRKTFGKKIVKISKNGERTLVDAPQALAERALELGLKGTLSANIVARQLAESHGPSEFGRDPDLTRLTDAELYLYGYLATKLVDEHAEVLMEPTEARIMKRISLIVEEEWQTDREAAKKDFWLDGEEPSSSRGIQQWRNEDPEEFD